MAENQELWEEENLDNNTELSSSAELRSAGITAGGIGGDIDSLGGSDTGEGTMDDSNLEGGEAAPAAGGTPGGAPAGGAPAL